MNERAFYVLTEQDTDPASLMDSKPCVSVAEWTAPGHVPGVHGTDIGKVTVPLGRSATDPPT